MPQGVVTPPLHILFIQKSHINNHQSSIKPDHQCAPQ
jgi:hypothetical protein